MTETQTGDALFVAMIGLWVNERPDLNFYEWLMGEGVTYFERGSFGVVFKIELTDEQLAHYSMRCL